ncbi:MAG: TonB-dependent receptor [Flavobacteriales bacterium]|jgi:iron complex outermembrane receptor protein
MTKLKFMVLAMLCAIATNSLAQTLNGKVSNVKNERIAQSIVSVLNKDISTITDNEGNYSLTLKSGTYLLQFQAEGYSSVIQKVSIQKDNVQLDVVLEESVKRLDEVVVTASKVEEDALAVPAAVSVLSSKKIENTRLWGLGGLTAIIPNYNYQELGVAFQQIQSIRGIQVFSENPAVSTYIDDVNNIDILANGFALTDIERIEVLRGPQGTLFGRNAMGGVVNIITKRPTNETKGFAEIGVGNFGLQRHSIGIKTPLIKDKLFFGLNGLYQKQDGWWRNDTTGTGVLDPALQGAAIGGEQNLYGNIYLRWIASPRFQLTLNFKGQRDWSNNSAFFVSQQDVDLAFEEREKFFLRRIAQHEREVSNTSLVAKYYRKNFTITSITAYQRIGLAFKDVDFPGFYSSFHTKEVGEPLPPQQVYTQEFRVNSVGDKRISYTAGLFSFIQEGYEPSTNTAYELSAPEAAFYEVPFGTSFISRNVSNNAGAAAFGELNFKITSWLKVTGGLRYDLEEREATFNGFADAAFINGEVVNFKPDTTVSGTYSALSPKFAVTYSINKLSNVYASYNRGFRAGGVNAQRYAPSLSISQTFDPEYSDNFELGYKSFLWNNKVSINAAVFYISWTDLQLFNLAAPFTYARSNIGDAQSLGAELEVSALPIKGLQVDAAIGFNQTEYGEFSLQRVNFFTAVETETDITGNSLSNAPSHTVFVAAQYEREFFKGAMKGFVRGEVRNICSYYTDIQNTLEQPTYTLISARAGIAFSKTTISFWVQNLTDETYLAFGTSDSSFGTSVRTAAPRTFGGSVAVNF